LCVQYVGVVVSTIALGASLRIIFNAVTTSLYQPFTCWDDLVDHQGILPDKMRKQIRDRWVNHLNPKLNHRPFTDEDDLILWKGQQKLGNKWVEISVNYFHSTRSDNHCRNRWYSPAFRKFINKTFKKNTNSHLGGNFKNTSTNNVFKRKKIGGEDGDGDDNDMKKDDALTRIVTNDCTVTKVKRESIDNASTSSSFVSMTPTAITNAKLKPMTFVETKRQRRQQHPTYVWVNSYHLGTIVDSIVLDLFDLNNNSTTTAGTGGRSTSPKVSDLPSNIKTIRIRWESTRNEETVLRSLVKLMNELEDDDTDTNDVNEEEEGRA
jgi:hypothetical protein